MSAWTRCPTCNTEVPDTNDPERQRALRLRGPSYGLARVYGRVGQLLLVAYVDERHPVTTLDQQLLLDHATEVTFTPTSSAAEARELAAPLRPLLGPDGRTGRTELFMTEARAERFPELATGPYLVACPECAAAQHSACRQGRERMAEVHPQRVEHAEQVAAEHAAVRAADQGYLCMRYPGNRRLLSVQATPR